MILRIFRTNIKSRNFSKMSFKADSFGSLSDSQFEVLAGDSQDFSSDDIIENVGACQKPSTPQKLAIQRPAASQSAVQQSASQLNQLGLSAACFPSSDFDSIISDSESGSSEKENGTPSPRTLEDEPGQITPKAGEFCMSTKEFSDKGLSPPQIRPTLADLSLNTQELRGVPQSTAAQKRSFHGDSQEDIWKEMLEMGLKKIQQSPGTPSDDSIIVSHTRKIPRIQETSPLKLSVPRRGLVKTSGSLQQVASISTQSQENVFTLSEEQNKVIQLILKGHNIFYTGSAGTGKSVLLKEAIKELKMRYKSGEVAVTASTGLAACNIGGITLHSFAGIGIGDAPVDVLLKKIRKSKKSKENWKNTKVLIVDEISMVSGALLDKLNAIGKAIRRSDEPFGGIQVVFCGDFYQLPPVTKKHEEALKNAENDRGMFAFDSQTWKESVRLQVILTKIFRQQSDQEFIHMLNEMRQGRLSNHSVSRFHELNRPLDYSDGIEPAELFSTRNEVENANLRRLRQLQGNSYKFKSIDGGSLPEGDAKERLLSNFIAPKELVLKKGAQVMMIKNLDNGLVNGSLGKVLDFIDPCTYCFYKKTADGEEINPKKLSKMKEDTKKMEALLESADTRESLDETVFDFFKNLEDKSMDEIQLANFDRKEKLIKDLFKECNNARYPLVRFLTHEGTTRDVLVCPETWDIEDVNETALVSRTQIPLILAWAISIHKSQGQTLTKARVDLKRVFEKGQAYVALSRVTNRDSLQVMNFMPSRVQTHDSVIEFYSGLLDVESAMEKARELESSAAFIARNFFRMEPPKVKSAKGKEIKGKGKSRVKATGLKFLESARY